MHYTFHQLQIFCKIVELRSITKASEHLNLTQPAVSIQLKNFQNQFPIALTEVVGRQLFVTDFGKEIAVAAQRILEESQTINYKTTAYQGKLSGRLKIASASTGKYVMPYFISDFFSSNPEIELFIDVTNKAKVVNSLENNEVDFALVSVLPDKLKLESVSLMSNSLYLVGSKAFNIEKRRSIKDLFEKTPLIYRENGSATRNAMEQFILKKGYKVNKKIELKSNEAVKQAVLANMGLSIVPLIGIKNELKNEELQIIPVKGLPLHTNWNLVWLSAKKLSPVALAYLEFIKDKKDSIIERDFQWVNDF
ncbi:LysR family transcriptional regulator [Nonlabens agnitus]|uniref:LysR family transcriptional regulator n=1 Tax=Nonlabens agnitus TaxID=870484 RepID=A0A2S9WXK3_9FLAO|nr:LysR family transcriptional regulator [Nonlabens agnitus]PRP68199.1 LysR family transcriptional regulator [Nonlabens agnitus]